VLFASIAAAFAATWLEVWLASTALSQPSKPAKAAADNADPARQPLLAAEEGQVRSNSV
jgi:hypothetical protein